MKPRVLAVLALAALLLTVPTAAQAKGATVATIDGGGPGGLPGGPITLRGDGEPGSGTDLGNLTDASGLFTLMFDSRRTATDRAPNAQAGCRPHPPTGSAPATPSPGPSQTTTAVSASTSTRMRPPAR
jgi:hypothetical protein